MSLADSLERHRRQALAARLRERAMADEDLYSFIPRVSRGRLEAPRHLAKVVDVARRIDAGEAVRVVVATPPRHGKTTTWLHVLAWLLRRKPDWPVAYITYAAELAQSKSYEARNIAAEAGVSIAKDRANLGEWMTTQGGRFVATGIGGALTGRGFRCFPAGTIVVTDAGPVPIEQLCGAFDGRNVLSLDHETGRCEWRRVVASAEGTSDEIVEVRTRGGRSFRCTADHRVYVAGVGYREAQFLTASDRLVVSTAVQLVPGGVRKDPLRDGQGGSEELQGLLLLGDMLSSASRDQERAAVRHMLLPDARSEHSEVLLLGLSSRGERASHGGVPEMCWDVPTDLVPNGLLWTGVRGRGALGADARSGQLALQGRKELREVVRRDAAADLGARWGTLRDLRGGADDEGVPARWERLAEVLACGAPHRPQPAEQPAREPDPALRQVPHDAPQVGYDTVAVVRPVRGESVRVYDIQVEGNSNFFAEGVLVHNCVLTDDPFKGRQEADSPLIRERTWEWFNSVAFTRQEPGGTAYVVNATRWHPNDLSGRLIAQGWEYVNLQAIDPQERALWPEKFSAEALRKIEQQIGPYEFGALYQGEPRQKGATVFGEPHYYDALPTAGYSISGGLDFAYTSNTWSDFSVLVVLWAHAGTYYVVDVIRMRAETPLFKREVLAAARRQGLNQSARNPGLNAYIGGTEKGILDLLRSPDGTAPLYVSAINASGAGDKFARAQPAAAAWNAGKVLLPRNMAALGRLGAHMRAGADDAVPWVAAFLDEICNFTGVSDPHDDQVDALAGAFVPFIQAPTTRNLRNLPPA